MKQFVIALSLIFIFGISYIAFVTNSEKDSNKAKVKGTSSMEHSFHTMKDGKGSLGTQPDYSKVGENREGKSKGITVPQYKPTTSGVEDYTNIGNQKNPNLPGAEKKTDKTDTSTEVVKTSTLAPTNLTTRQKHVSESGVPEKYRDLKSPAMDAARIKAGKDIFNSRCKACHGAKGYGDGPVGASLNPRPSNLSEVVAASNTTDGYLFWTLTEGGSPLGTAMISLKSLPEADRWNIIAYLRAEIAKK